MAIAVGMKDSKTIEEARHALETYRSLPHDDTSQGPKVRLLTEQEKCQVIDLTQKMN